MIKEIKNRHHSHSADLNQSTKEKSTKKRKQIVAAVSAMLVLFGLTACSAKSTSSTRSHSNKDKDHTYGSQQKDSKTSALVKMLMDHLDDWQYVSDTFTQAYTYDEICISSMTIYTKGTAGEYYLSADYVLSPSKNLLMPYYQFFHFTEHGFEYLYSSEEPLIAVEDIFTTDYVLLGMQQINVTGNVEESLENLIDQCLAKETSYYGQLNSYGDQQIELTNEEASLYDNINQALKSLEYYEFENGHYSTTMPLTNIQFYVLGNGSCEAVLWYSDIREKGYSIDKNGYQELPNSATQRLINTSKKISLEWDIKWTTEKKEYMLKKAISEQC